MVRNESDSETLSWTVGPAESRLVRVLLYLAEGFFGGGIVVLLVAFGRSLLPTGFAGSSWTLVVLAFAGLPLAWKFWIYFVRRSNHLTVWLWHDWLAVHRWWWALSVAILVGGVLVAVVLRSPWYSYADRSAWFGALFVSLACALLAGLLSSKGELDSKSLTLTTLRYGEWRDLDLRMLTVTERATFGPHAVVWLSVSPGVENRTATQGFYSVPADVLDRAWPAFEAGLAADPPIDDETIARGRFFRRVNRTVAVGFFLFALAVVAGMAWLGGPLFQLLVAIWALAGFGFLLLKLAA